MNDLNICVVGGGYWGKNLIRNFYNLNSLYCICDNNKNLKDFYKSQYPNIEFFSDYEKVLNDKNIDGIVISTPPISHYKLAKNALLNNKNVFVEKPLCLNLNDADELINLSKEKNKILMVGHILNYHPAIIRLKEIIDNNELGNIQYISSRRVNWGKIRNIENILWSFAPHDISIILMILNNKLPLSLRCVGGNYIQKDIEDLTITFLNFENNIKSNIFVSWLHPFKEQRLIIICEKSSIVFDDVSNNKLTIYPNKSIIKNGIVELTKSNPVPVKINDTEPLNLECLEFLNCIKNNKQPKTNGEEGLRVLKVLYNSQKSLDKGGEEIEF